MAKTAIKLGAQTAGETFKGTPAGAAAFDKPVSVPTFKLTWARDANQEWKVNVLLVYGNGEPGWYNGQGYASKSKALRGISDLLNALGFGEGLARAPTIEEAVIMGWVKVKGPGKKPA